MPLARLQFIYVSSSINKKKLTDSDPFNDTKYLNEVEMIKNDPYEVYNEGRERILLSVYLLPLSTFLSPLEFFKTYF